ncbi:hypothetical protein BGZ83_004697, partial [Gryganskiella cystojenkinii]
MPPKRKGPTKVPTPDPADQQEQGADDREDTDQVDNDEVEMQDHGDSDPEHADEAFDERLAHIIADLEINEEASSESSDDDDYDESEEGLRAQAVKVVKALRLGSAQERTELRKLDDVRNARRDDVKKQVRYLEDCVHDADRALKAKHSLDGDDYDDTRSSSGREADKVVDDYVVKWDPADPVHAAIKAIYKIDHIPILP